MSTRTKIIAGNWKMFKTTAEAVAYAEEFKTLYAGGEHDVAICAPFTQLAALKEAFAGTEIGVGAQNVHFEESGAFTGEIAPAMLTEIGVDYVVIGHSERRQYFNETDDTCNLKLVAAFKHGLKPILCVGEVLSEREAGEQNDVVARQLEAGVAGLSEEHIEQLIIAYEPVWAIGTGKTATSAQAEEMCAFIRSEIADLYSQEEADKVRIQYGGSVKAANAKEILTQPNIDGALVGGASLVPADFLGIVKY
ncbi:MAG: triose-phosphate isomerase [Clostridiales Family XIII bacterium]|jgi:triosephosphate isomerase|nr:triose-phosphate isomerase [Clostridiales Family XIII bacterium]